LGEAVTVDVTALPEQPLEVELEVEFFPEVLVEAGTVDVTASPVDNVVTVTPDVGEVTTDVVAIYIESPE
jgi:hypothetical protein